MATLHFTTLLGRTARRTSVVLAALALVCAPGRAVAQQVVNACYVPSVAAVYLIGLPGSPTACLAPGHIPVTLRDTLANGSVTPAKLSFDPATQAELDALRVLGTINDPNNPVDWTELKNVPSGFADGTDNVGGGGGTVTSITVGPGLVASPDPITTTGTLSVNLAGPGSATSVARSDHNHATSDGDGPNIGSNQLHWDRLTGVPSGFADGVDNGDSLADGAVTTAKLAANAVTGGNIAAGTITRDNIAASTIDSSVLANNAVQIEIQNVYQTVTVTPGGTGVTAVISCPSTGGWYATGSLLFSNTTANSDIIVLQSNRRSSGRVWDYWFWNTATTNRTLDAGVACMRLAM